MRRGPLVGLLMLALAAVAAPPADATFGFAPDSVQVTSLDASGQPDMRAGAHPDTLLVSFAFTTTPAGEMEANARDVVVDLPPGYTGDADAMPHCGRADIDRNECPSDTQVGVASVDFVGLGTLTLPIYNIVTEQGGIAELGFFVFLLPVRLDVTLRSDGDYGMRVTMSDLVQAVPLRSARIELWGVPADHQTGTTIPRRAFLTTPTRCDEPLRSTVRVRTWQPDAWIADDVVAGAPQTECENLDLSPSAVVVPSTTTVDSPTGLRVEIDVPQHSDPGGLVSAQASRAVVRLPAGFALSPTVAQGLAGCDDAQAAIGSTNPPLCPGASRIGTVEIDTPLVTRPLRGGIYIAAPAPGDAFRLFLMAQGPGFTVKLRGSLRRDPDADQIVATVNGLPQVPFSHVALTFKDGPRAPFATSTACGLATATVALSSYAGRAPADATSAFTVVGPGDGPCPTSMPFAPSVVAGVSPALAGAGSTLSVRISRSDDQQTLNRITLVLPPGLSARVASVGRCSDAQIAAAACPASSRIGSVTAWVGPGPAPLPVAGSAYLTDSYRGAPFGLALVLPVRAGPFDLGVVVVRAALGISSGDGHLTVAIDRLPQQLGDVTLRLQALAIAVDRPGFLVNPTSCAPTRIASVVTANEGATEHTATRFGLRGCRRLPFGFGARVAPLGGTARKPGLRVSLRRTGAANLRSATLVLPRLLGLDVRAVTAVCGRGEAQGGRCPAAARVGTASLRTPLLSGRLSGPVYAVASDRTGGMPGLWASLQAGGVRILLKGATSVRAGDQVASTFSGLPDVPLSAFELRLAGGAHGILTTDASMCRLRGGQGTAARITAQAQAGLRRSRLIATGPWRRCGDPRR